MRRSLQLVTAITLLLLLSTMAAGSTTASFETKQTHIKVIGDVICAESNVALTTGRVRIGQEEYTITNGTFEAQLIPGHYTAILEGPYRQSKQVTLNITPKTNRVEIALDSVFSAEEIHVLARITRAEAEGESFAGKTAVAATILNRVNSPRYPNTIKGVVYQKVSGRYQFSPVLDGRINLNPTPNDYKAAYRALAGHDPSNGATGFYNPAKTSDKWVRSHPVTAKIGQHTFFFC